MEALILNKEIENRLMNFCSQALLEHTYDIFATKGVVIRDDNFQLNATNLMGVTVHSVWFIDEFINEEDCNLTDKINILLSYIECGGCVFWGNENYSGRYFVPFLRRLLAEHYITEAENAIIFGMWADYKNGKIPAPYFDLSA